MRRRPARRSPTRGPRARAACGIRGWRGTRRAPGRTAITPTMSRPLGARAEVGGCRGIARCPPLLQVPAVPLELLGWRIVRSTPSASSNPCDGDVELERDPPPSAKLSRVAPAPATAAPAQRSRRSARPGAVRRGSVRLVGGQRGTSRGTATCWSTSANVTPRCRGPGARTAATGACRHAPAAPARAGMRVSGLLDGVARRGQGSRCLTATIRRRSRRARAAGRARGSATSSLTRRLRLRRAQRAAAAHQPWRARRSAPPARGHGQPGPTPGSPCATTWPRTRPRRPSYRVRVRTLRDAEALCIASTR